jgi:phenylalanyl-tRNA synthetase beta chain
VLSKPDAGRLVVDAPGWRPDLTQEIDLVEEIARLHGYGRFPEALRPYRPTQIPEDPLDLTSRRVRQGLISMGLYETQAFPLVAPEGADSVRLLNPLNAEEGALRRRLLPGLVRQIEANWSGRVRDIRLFEIGTVFTAGDPGARPHEAWHVAGVISGAREPAHWSEGGRAADADFWDLKGLFEGVVSLALPGGALQVDGESLVALDAAGAAVGRAERVPMAGPPWAAPVFGFELLVVAHPAPVPKFRPLPGTPAVERDLALILGSDRTLAEVEAQVRKRGGPLLESVAAFDEYRGSGLPGGTRSVAVRLVFRAPDRTLRDAEVDPVVSRIVAVLEDELGIQLRTT